MTKTSSTTERLLRAIRANPRGRYQEWADAIGVKSTSTVGYHLHKLEQEGKIRLYPGKARSVELTGTPDEWREMERYARTMTIVAAKTEHMARFKGMFRWV